MQDGDAIDTRALALTLAAAERGDVQATAELFTALYRELHRLARKQLHLNASGLTLGATTLLHEAYLNLSQRGTAFPDRARFFAYAARAMRGLIVDYVRERRAFKRGGEYQLTTWDTASVEAAAPPTDDLAPLSEALDALAVADPALAELWKVRLRRLAAGVPTAPTRARRAPLRARPPEARRLATTIATCQPGRPGSG